MSMDQATVTMYVGESEQLKVTMIHTSGQRPTLSWTSSNPEVAGVENGLVTGKRPGSAVISAQAQGVSVSCAVTVRAIEVTGVSIGKTTLSLVEGNSYQLSASVTPANATDKTVQWTSDRPSIAAVDSYGNVTAIKAGEAHITAKAGTKSAMCQVLVNPKVIEVTGIVLDKMEISLTEGETYTLAATVSPSNATDKTVTWSSSSTSVTTVSSSGVVTAVKAGTATITAKAGSKTATCKVTVAAKVIEVTGITLDKTSLSMTEGETCTLAATVSPSNATDKTITWSSSNTSVATVSSSGVVTAVKAGTATITAKAGTKTATCKVTVAAKVIEVTGITLNKISLSMTEGDTYTLAATVSPSNATDKTVIWSSSNTSVATVSSSGVVTAVKAGTATITTKAGMKTATCKVTVAAKVIEVTGITLDKTSLSMTEGETYALVATVSPSNATDKTVIWSSSNTSVATVSSSGLVSATMAGTTTITAKSGSKAASCLISVFNKTLPSTFDISTSSYNEEMWNSNLNYAQLGCSVKTFDDGTWQNVFESDLNSLFRTWKPSDKGIPGLIAIDPSIKYVKYYFDENILRINKIYTFSVAFEISSDGTVLYATLYDSSKAHVLQHKQIVATIDNSYNGTSASSTLILNKNSKTAKILLNCGPMAFHIFIGAKGYQCNQNGIINNTEIPLTFGGKSFFEACFLRPIDFSDTSESFKQKTRNYIALDDILHFWDWQGQYSQDNDDLWYYYGPFHITVDTENVLSTISGRVEALPSYIQIQQVNFINGVTPINPLGYLTYNNGGLSTSSDFDLYINVTVDYTWGTIELRNLRIKVIAD